MPARELFRGEDDGGAAIRERAAVEELERVGDVGAPEHRLEGDLLPELRLGVVDPVPVVLHGHVRHLLLGGPVLLHVGARDEGEDAGEGEPDGLLVGGVGAEREVLRGVVRRDVEDPLPAAHQDHVGDAGPHLHHRVAERNVARGAGVLEARGGDGGEPQERGGERARVKLALALAAGDIAVVEGLDGGGGDLRVGDGVAVGLREQLRAVALMLAELRHPYPDHGDSAHPSLLRG